MLNFLVTLGEQPKFQKNLLILTQLNYDAPNEKAMKSILQTFSGEDEHTRAQIAFASAINKINNSSSKDNWLYLLKNLIILDKFIMSENSFCQQLVQTKLYTIQNYIDKDTKCLAINSKQLITQYWQIIQGMCRLEISKNHILYYKRSERRCYLQSLHTKQIFRQIQILQKQFDICISLIFLTSGISNNKLRNQRNTQVVIQKQKKYYKQFVDSNLAQYLNIRFYCKLLTFYSCQYLCIHKFIQIILHTTKSSENVRIEDAKHFKKMVCKFRLNCYNMILIAEENKNKKGFDQIDVKEFNTFSEKNIIKVVDQYILQNISISEFQRNRNIKILLTPQNQHLKLRSQKFVHKKPSISDRFYSVCKKTPRKFIDCRKQQEQDNAFQNYFNSFSDEFPHKSMMTLDLIQDIKSDQKREYQRILDQVECYAEAQDHHIQLEQQNEKDFFKEFKQSKSNVKFRDILIFDKDYKEQQKWDFANGPSEYSQRGGSLFDLLDIKWIPQQGKV